MDYGYDSDPANRCEYQANVGTLHDT